MRRTKLTRGRTEMEINQMVDDVVQIAKEKINHIPIRLFYLSIHFKMMGFDKKEIKRIIMGQIYKIYKEGEIKEDED